MSRIPMAFGELRPDIALLDNQFASVADNVFAAINSYKPIPAPVPLNAAAAALPATCLGLFAARKADGSWKIYAGTATDLYLWTVTGWTSATRLAGGSYNVVNRWTFAQFGTNLYACSGLNDVLQSIDIEAGVNFAATAGSPPLAKSVNVVGDFLVLAGLGTNPLSIEFSSINNPTGWVIGVNLCDVQTFPEGGPVLGVGGNESVGYVLQDRAIRTMQFLPGDTTFIFDFTRVVKDRGCISAYGFATNADILYFPTEDGFYALANAQLLPIGQDKINEWFILNSDPTRRYLTQAFSHNRPFIIWAFYGSGASLSYDRLLIFNWSNQRWSTGTIQSQGWALISSTPLDEETTGSEVGDVQADNVAGSGDTPPMASSLDSPLYQGGRPLVALITPTGALCTLTGMNLAALMETAEQHLVPAQRAFVSEAYPRIDSAQCSVIPGTRERLGDPIVFGTPVSLEKTGSASVLVSARLHRYRVSTPTGDTWTNALGVDAEAQPDGYA